MLIKAPEISSKVITMLIKAPEIPEEVITIMIKAPEIPEEVITMLIKAFTNNLNSESVASHVISQRSGEIPMTIHLQRCPVGKI